MRRLALVLAMIFATLWQSTASVGPGTIANLLADEKHAALHLHAEGHHHHDDGSVHLDDSKASIVHVLGDCAASTTGILPTALNHFLPHAPGKPGTLNQARPASPFLDGLLRPPQATS